MAINRVSYQSVPPLRIGYVSFDTVPAPKGAATHIGAFARALACRFGEVELATAAPGLPMPATIERWPGVLHTELPAAGKSLIDRVLCFRRFEKQWLDSRGFDVVQFRSIFEGVPLLKLRPRPRLVFEVNGLPSIELKYRYPKVVDDRELMRKLIAQENACLRAAHCVVTPSAVTQRYLACERGVDASKIRVIPNGVDLEVFHRAPDSAEPGALSLLYFGTLASWQGLETAIRALAQIAEHEPARLVIIGAGGRRQRRDLIELAAKLEVASSVELLDPLSQPDLVRHIHASFAILAPLAMSDRNFRQGCCPLKVLEAMAAGIPVIASDVPPVRELGDGGTHLLLVKPGSVEQLAQAVLRLRADPDLWRNLAANARARVESCYTWDHAGRPLGDLIEELCAMRPAIASRA
jgi:glycosyltransferase involved in cell wall biosynthesis